MLVAAVAVDAVDVASGDLNEHAAAVDPYNTVGASAAGRCGVHSVVRRVDVYLAVVDGDIMTFKSLVTVHNVDISAVYLKAAVCVYTVVRRGHRYAAARHGYVSASL